MRDWTQQPCLTQVGALTEVPADRRAALRDGPADHAIWRAALDTIPALREVEVGGTAVQEAGATGTLRIVAWNVERLRFLHPVAQTLTGADVCLLTEIDKGMARTGNTHRTAELAELIGQNYAYGAEFIELDRGTTAERTAHADTENALGFHGNAVLSRFTLHRPALFRLEAEGKWFGWDRDEPRVGSRMAIGGQVQLDGVMVTLVAVHLESHSDPDHRAGQVAQLLDLLDEYDAHAPVLIGGDFNTSTMGRGPDGFSQPDLRDDPHRLVRVEPFEPLFALMAGRGFEWTACNVPDAPTQRFPDALMPRPLGKIDWIFTRGLTATKPAVLPALCADGTPSSDHEALFVEISL